MTSSFVVNAPAWLLADPIKLGAAQRWYAERGIAVELSLRDDGTLVVDTDADEALVRSLARDLAPALRPDEAADQSAIDVLRAYRSNSTPTNAQSVAAIKALIDVVERQVRRG